MTGMLETEELGPAERDDQLQMAVLGHVLLAYPAPLTLEEIVTVFEEPFRRSFQDTDGIQRAVRDLVCGGLLKERDGSVLPTRATFRFSQLVGL